MVLAIKDKTKEGAKIKDSIPTLIMVRINPKIKGGITIKLQIKDGKKTKDGTAIPARIKDGTIILARIKDGTTITTRIKNGEMAQNKFQVKALIKIGGKIQLNNGAITRIQEDLIKAQHLVGVIKAIQVTHGALQTLTIGTIHLE